MFHYTPEGWKMLPKKIKYKQEIETYDITEEPYSGFLDLVVEDVELTDEQRCRFETVKLVSTMGVDEVMSYVLDGELVENMSYEMNVAIRDEMNRRSILSSLDLGSLTKTQVLAFSGFFREYSVDSFYMSGDVIKTLHPEGTFVYIVLSSHTATDDDPSDDPQVYEPITDTVENDI